MYAALRLPPAPTMHWSQSKETGVLLAHAHELPDIPLEPEFVCDKALLAHLRALDERIEERMRSRARSRPSGRSASYNSIGKPA